MMICLCKGVSDKKVRWLVQNGACSVREVMQRCHAGSDCGACVADLKSLVDQTVKEVASTESTTSPAANE